MYMYDKKNYKCDVACSLPPPLCHKLSHFLGPPPLEQATRTKTGISNKYKYKNKN